MVQWASADGTNWMKVVWTISESPSDPLHGNVSFVCTAPGSVWISLALNTQPAVTPPNYQGKMYGPEVGVAIVGQPNDATIDPDWYAKGGPLQMIYMRGYGTNSMDNVRLPIDGLPAPSVTYDPVAAITTLKFVRAFDDRGSSKGVTWGDPRDLPFSLRTPQAWIYGIGYDQDTWKNGHPLRGYDVLSLRGCSRESTCGGHGNCTAAALAFIFVPGVPQCTCDDAGWSAASGCKDCVPGYVKTATGCVPQTGLSVTITSTLALSSVVSTSSPNTTLLKIDIAAAVGVDAGRIVVDLSTATAGVVSLTITISDPLIDSTAALTATKPPVASVAVATTLVTALTNATLTQSGSSSSSSVLTIAIINAVAKALAISAPAALTTVSASSAVATVASFCATGGCAFPFSATLSNGMSFAWRLDQLALHMQLTWVRPGSDYVNSKKGGTPSSPQPALNWFGVALSPNVLMPGGDSVVVEPGQPDGLRVRRWTLAGYAMADCTLSSGEPSLSSYTSFSSIYTPPDTSSTRRLVAGAPSPDTWVTTATFSRALSASSPGSFSITDLTSTTITWGWGSPPGQGTLGFHTTKESGALILDLSTGVVRTPPCGSHCFPALAAHVLFGTLAFCVFLPFAFASSTTAQLAAPKASKVLTTTQQISGGILKASARNASATEKLGIICSLSCLIAALVYVLQAAGRMGTPQHFVTLHGVMGIGAFCAVVLIAFSRSCCPSRTAYPAAAAITIGVIAAAFGAPSSVIAFGLGKVSSIVSVGICGAIAAFITFSTIGCAYCANGSAAKRLVSRPHAVRHLVADPTTASTGNPAAHWEKVVDDDGAVFYENRATGATSWSLPKGVQLKETAPLKFRRVVEPDGVTFFVNVENDEHSEWILPQGAVLV